MSANLFDYESRKECRSAVCGELSCASLIEGTLADQ